MLVYLAICAILALALSTTEHIRGCSRLNRHLVFVYCILRELVPHFFHLTARHLLKARRCLSIQRSNGSDNYTSEVIVANFSGETTPVKTFSRSSGFFLSLKLNTRLLNADLYLNRKKWIVHIEFRTLVGIWNTRLNNILGLYPKSFAYVWIQ